MTAVDTIPAPPPDECWTPCPCCGGAPAIDCLACGWDEETVRVSRADVEAAMGGGE